MSQDASDPLAVARRWFAAVTGKDHDAMAALLTEDTTQFVAFNEAGDLDWADLCRAAGRDAVLEYWHIAWTRERSLALHVEDMVGSADGTTVFAEVTGDIEMADGRPYRNRYVYRLDLRDGQVARVRTYYNPVNSARAFDRPITL
jgi:ketosteroid isomerase-like protein